MQSYTFREFNLEQTLKRMKDFDLHYAELYRKHAPLQSSPDQISALLKLCKEYEVTPLAWGVQKFTKDTDANRKIFEFGKALGLTMFSDTPNWIASTAWISCVRNTRSQLVFIRMDQKEANDCIGGTPPKIILKAVKDHNALHRLLPGHGSF